MKPDSVGRIENTHELMDSNCKPRLWMINHYAISPDMPGGSRHFELARELRSFGWETCIFATPFVHSAAELVRSLSAIRPFMSEAVEGVLYRWIYTSPYTKNDWRRYANMVSFALGVLPSSIRQKHPSAIIGSSPHLLAALAAWVLSKRYRVPFILEIRDLWPDTLIQMGLNNPPLIRILEIIERFLYRRSDLILVLTEGIGDSIRAKGVPQDKIVFLPNASLKPTKINENSRQAIRNSHGWSGSVIAIYAGAHGPANALDRIIDAARELSSVPRLKMVLVGDGPAKPELISQAKDLPNVIFLDPVPKNEVSALLRAADIGILSLRQTKVFEGARPNKLFDYMANGLPIVSTIGGEVAKVLNEAGSGIYPPGGDIASALRELASSPDDREYMGRRGLEYVSKTLTREDSARTLAEHINSLVPGSSKQG